MEVTNEQKQILNWIETEVVANKVMRPMSTADKAYNEGIDKALNFIRRYKTGRGLFQYESGSGK